jgi:hypothetical protein
MRDEYDEFSEKGFILLTSLNRCYQRYSSKIEENKLTEGVIATQNHLAFKRVLWPMVRDVVTVSTCIKNVKRLKSMGLYPLKKTSNITGTQYKDNRILNFVWHASRYYAFWLILIAFNRIIRKSSKRLIKGR